MKKPLKDRLSVVEVGELLSESDSTKKKEIQRDFEQEHWVELYKLSFTVRPRTEKEYPAWSVALEQPIVSRDEVIGYADRKGIRFEEDKEILDQPMNISEDLVTQVRVHFVNNSEIGIQERIGRPMVSYTFKSLGFGKKAQDVLLQILEDRDHVYKMGAAREQKRQPIKDYWSQQEMLKSISKKFVECFNKTFNWKIPKNFKCYERVKSEESGTYKFKFQLVNKDLDGEGSYQISKKKCLATIEELKRINLRDMTPKQSGSFTQCLPTAQKKGWMKHDEIKEMLKNHSREAIESDIHRGKISDPLGDEEYPESQG